MNTVQELQQKHYESKQLAFLPQKLFEKVLSERVEITHEKP